MANTEFVILIFSIIFTTYSIVRQYDINKKLNENEFETNIDRILMEHDYGLIRFCSVSGIITSTIMIFVFVDAINTFQ